MQLASETQTSLPPGQVFSRALQDVLETTLMVAPEIEWLEPSGTHTLEGSTALLPLVGVGQGLLLLTAGQDFIQWFIRELTGDENPSGPEQGDAIAELANMVAGNAKRELANTPYSIELGVPIKVMGHQETLVRYHGKAAERFRGRCDRFDVTVALWLEAHS